MREYAMRVGYQAPTIDETEGEKEEKTERERDRTTSIDGRRNRCTHSSYYAGVRTSSCGKGVASYAGVRERERQEVRVSGKIAHPENQAYT